MKKGIILILSCIFLCWGCYDELNNIGDGTIPPKDKISIYPDTFQFSAYTKEMDSVYARSVSCQLGKLYTSAYGTVEADYLCQFYMPPGFSFPKGISGIDSTTVEIFYNSWVGDSLALMQATVKTLKQSPGTDFYTNVNISDYVDGASIGTRSYTPSNLSMKNDTLMPNISINLSAELGQRFYEESLKPGENAFSNQNTFNEFFPGLYITTSGGMGNILNVSYTILSFHYKLTENNEVVKKNITISATTEVIQLNRVKSENPGEMPDNGKPCTFLKTPAGLCTVVKLPVWEIMESKKSGTDGYLNTVNFSMKTYPREMAAFNLPAPPRLLMIRPDSITDFFEQRKVPDYKNTYIASFDSTALTYNFGNISVFVDSCYSKLKAAGTIDSIEVALIPVSIETDANSNISSVNNYLSPAFIRLRLDENYTDVPVISSKF